VPLSWVRLDTAFPFNQKLLAMLQHRNGHRAAFVYICGLAISGGQSVDGFISAETLPFTHGRAADADLLVEFGFWVPQPGGWLINGWDEFQQSTEETQLRRKRAQAAAETRWAGHEAVTDAERARQYRERRKADGSETGLPGPSRCASRCASRCGLRDAHDRSRP